MRAAAGGILAAVAVLAVLAPVGARPRRPASPGPAPRSRCSAVARLGGALARRTGLDPDPMAARALGWAAALALPLALVGPPLGPAAVGGAWVAVRHRQSRARARAQAQVDALLPDVVDLLLLCTSSGMGLGLAHDAVAPHVEGPLGAALRSAAARAGAGVPRAEALVAALTPCGERARALAHLLADHLRYGAPLGPSLDRLALELRLDRQRRAEEAARRVPVRLLGPLVTCTLPAFALLTVVPLLAVGLEGLPR